MVTGMDPELDPAIREYYERGGEWSRLVSPGAPGPLEFVRTRELIDRYLSGGRLDVLDVGGGPGRYAAWLAERGHRVTLIDPVPLHVQQATEIHPQVSARTGDARQLPQEDGSVDVVLLLGPLYHLVEPAERIAALREAHRVLRGTGVVFVAAIGRFAALLDLLLRHDRLHEPALLPVVEEVLRTGVFRGTEGDLFTTAYFHRPAELRDEVERAGFTDVDVLSVEGPGAFAAGFEERWADPDRRAVLLAAARLVESDPDMLGSAGHLLAVGRGR